MSVRRVIKDVARDRKQAAETVPVGQVESPGFVPVTPSGFDVQCHREGGVVKHIDVRCQCGCTMRLLCEYESDGDSGINDVIS